jgi:hypothetical protein
MKSRTKEMRTKTALTTSTSTQAARMARNSLKDSLSLMRMGQMGGGRWWGRAMAVGVGAGIAIGRHPGAASTGVTGAGRGAGSSIFPAHLRASMGHLH